MSRRNANKLLAILHGIFEHAVREHGLLVNPVKDVEKLRYLHHKSRVDDARQISGAFRSEETNLSEAA